MVDLYEQMSQTRRELHKIAEPAWLEFETTIKLIDILKSHDIDILYGKEIHGKRPGLPTEEKMKEHRESLDISRTYNISEILEGYTGVVADIDTGKEGPYVGFRFDIDANDVVESESESHRPTREGFRSKNEFAMHACGHDGHTTIGLFVTKWINDNRDKLKGKYRIIFQPAEEGARGAGSMVEAGLVDEMDYFISGHIGLGVGSNIISLGTTGFLATTKWDINFIDKNKDLKLEDRSLLAGASCALNLHTLTQHSTGMSRVNVGRIEAGDIGKDSSKCSKLYSEIRGSNLEIFESLNKRLKEVVVGSSRTYGVDYSLENVGWAPSYEGFDEDLIYGISDQIKDKKKPYSLEFKHDFGAGEDVTIMMLEVEGQGGRVLHLMYGSDLAAGHHNDRFDFDETTLVNGYDAIKEIIKYINISH